MPGFFARAVTRELPRPLLVPQFIISVIGIVCNKQFWISLGNFPECEAYSIQDQVAMPLMASTESSAGIFTRHALFGFVFESMVRKQLCKGGFHGLHGVEGDALELEPSPFDRVRNCHFQSDRNARRAPGWPDDA